MQGPCVGLGLDSSEEDIKKGDSNSFKGIRLQL